MKKIKPTNYKTTIHRTYFHNQQKTRNEKKKETQQLLQNKNKQLQNITHQKIKTTHTQ